MKLYWDLMPEKKMVDLYAHVVCARILPLKATQSARASYQIDDVQDSPVSTHAEE